MIIAIALAANRKYYTTSELKNMGYSYYKIGQMEDNGQLHRITKTTYENLSYNGDENDFVNAAAFVPDGVICPISVARYYELTDFLPDVIDVAIERKKKVSTLPDWSEIKIFYFAALRMDTSVVQIMEGSDSFRIFDIEKTVVDIIYYRNVPYSQVGVPPFAVFSSKVLDSERSTLNILYESQQFIIRQM